MPQRPYLKGYIISDYYGWMVPKGGLLVNTPQLWQHKNNVW